MGTQTLSIEKYDKKQIADMRSDKLSLATDRYVEEMFSTLETTRNTLSELNKLKDSEGEKPDWTSAVLATEIQTARKNVRNAVSKINDYISEQRALFISKKMDPDMVFKWAIIPTGKKNEKGVEMCSLVKRGVMIQPDYGDSDDIRVRTCVLPSEKMHLSNELRRGRYNDAGMLIIEAACSIDPSEATPEEGE